MAQSRVSILIEAKDNASSVFKGHAQALNEASRGYESLSDYMKRMHPEFDSVGQGIDGLTKRIGNLRKEQQDAARSMLTAPGESSRKKLESVTKQLSQAESDLSKATKILGTSQNEAADAADTAAGKFDGLFKTFTLANLAATAIEKGIQLATDAIQDSVQQAANYERQLLGLNAAAQSFGVSTEDMNAAIQRLTSDGLLTFGQVANGIKNLLASGLDIDSAVSLMERFKDEAAFGRAETIKYGDAVVNLSEAFMTGSSQMGNLNGHTANFSDALEIGAAALGKTTDQLSAAETEQAKLIGYMQQGAYTAGNAAQYADTYAGSLSRMETESQKASVSLGQLLIPAADYATQSFGSFLASLNGASGGSQELQAYLVTLAAVVRSVAQVVVGSAQVMFGAFKSLASLSLDPLNQGIDAAAQGFTDSWDDAWKQYENIYSESQDNQLSSLQGLLASMEKEYETSTLKRSQQETDLTRQFQRQMEQRAKSFSESLRDMVIAHRDKALSIKADLAQEDAEYARSAKKREADYLEDIASLQERYAEKVASIREQIDEEEKQGILDNGVFYSTANREKVAKLEQSLRDEERKHQEAIDKRKADYAVDVQEAKAAHDEKIRNLQEQLSQELVILNKHREDVARIGDAQKEDDLSRLKRQFAEQNAEAIRNHNEQLARVRTQGAAQGNAYGDEFRKKIEELRNRILELQKQGSQEQEKQAKDSGAKAGGAWLSGFSQSMENFRNNNSWGRMIQELTRQQDQFVQGIAKFFGIDPKAASRLFTGRATGGRTGFGETTLVGERGPEIAEFPAGTKIIPADQTRRILPDQGSGGATINYNVGTQIIQSPVDFQAELRWIALKTR